MDVRHQYVPIRRTRRTARGLSELQLKTRLEKQGWTVWRGGQIGMTRKAEIYPNVERKYTLLIELLKRDHPDHVELLQYLCAVHHGMPDYLCYRQKTNEWKFVECKYKHEQLSQRQKTCIQKLSSLGFTVEVHKLVDHQTKARNAMVNLKTGAKKVNEQQLKLNSKRIKELTKQYRILPQGI